MESGKEIKVNLNEIEKAEPDSTISAIVLSSSLPLREENNRPSNQLSSSVDSPTLNSFEPRRSTSPAPQRATTPPQQQSYELPMDLASVNSNLESSERVTVEYELKRRSAFYLSRMTEGSVGYDIASAEEVIVYAGKTKNSSKLVELQNYSYKLIFKKGTTRLIDSGVVFKLPANTYGQLIGRIRLACVGIVLHEGVIDNDFEGTIKIVLHNLGTQNFVVREGDRLARIIFKKNDPIFAVNVLGEPPEVLYEYTSRVNQEGNRQ